MTEGRLIDEVAALNRRREADWPPEGTSSRQAGRHSRRRRGTTPPRTL